MGNCVVPESLCWGIPLIFLCSTALPTCLHLLVGTGKSWPVRDLQDHLVHPLNLQIQKLSPERGSHSPGHTAAWGGTVFNNQPSKSQKNQPMFSLAFQCSCLNIHSEADAMPRLSSWGTGWESVSEDAVRQAVFSFLFWRNPGWLIQFSALLAWALGACCWLQTYHDCHEQYRQGGEQGVSFAFSWPVFRLKLGVGPRLRTKKLLLGALFPMRLKIIKVYSLSFLCWVVPTSPLSFKKQLRDASSMKPSLTTNPPIPQVTHDLSWATL